MQRSVQPSVKSRWAIENSPLNIFVTLLTVLALAPAALAGIVDSPVPSLGPHTKVAYSVTGVINSPFLGTYFACTSTASSAQQVGVEVFGATGGAPVTDAVATQWTLNPGATVLFGTGGANGLSIDSSLGAPTTKGSARILSTSTLICTTYLADKITSPPAASWQLTIVAKTKQKGD